MVCLDAIMGDALMVICYAMVTWTAEIAPTSNAVMIRSGVKPVCASHLHGCAMERMIVVITAMNYIQHVVRRPTL